MLYYYPDFRVRKYNKPNGRFDWYETTEETSVHGAIDDFIVPVGFVTDFASVPRIFQSLIPAHGLAMPASILHDFMYSSNHFKDLLGDSAARYYADDLFRRNLLDMGIKKWQVFLMFTAVRIFGAKRWRNKGGRS